MKREKFDEAVEISLRVLDKTATEGDKVALQMFLMLLTKKDERAYGKVLSAAINKVSHKAFLARQEEEKKAKEQHTKDFLAGRIYADGCPRCPR